ncbi:MAG: hypothetical protein Q4D56_05780 [Bacteroides sp.]|nr:hypothetical protein [Bacteroides sp.]
MKKKGIGCLFLLMILAAEAMVLISLVSCGSSRKAIDASSVLQDSTMYVSKDSTTTTTTTKTMEDESIEEVTETTVYTYDTSKPVDTLTNKHPLLMEEKSITRKTTGKKKQEQKEEAVQAVAEEQLVSQRQEAKNVNVESVKEETTVPKQIGNASLKIGITAIILAALVIVGRLVYKRMKK